MPKLFNKFPCRHRGEAIPKICVYKIWADEKFMIWKGKSLTQSVATISGQIDLCLRKPPAPGHLLEKLMAQIEGNRCLYVEIEVVKYASDPLDMLKTEYAALASEKNNPNCLNMSFESYIPKWIPLIHVEEFEKWKQSLTQQS